MKITDIVFALACGWMVNWVVFDFLKEYGVDFGFWRWLLGWVLPIISLFCLWLAFKIGKKIAFIFQAAKFFLVGTFADVIDIKFFQLLFLFFPSITLEWKAISFLVATAIKFWGNKHWAFEKPEKDGMKKELVQFFAVTLVGLGINVGSFYCATNIIGPKWGIPVNLWIELSIIFAAIVASIWNFLGYKFLVFKK